MDNFAALFSILELISDFFWSYIGFTIVVIMGIYLTFKSRFFQIKVLLNPKKYLYSIKDDVADDGHGTHPLKLYFTSIGGMIGLGNLVSVVTIITIGGPGGLFWLWVVSLAGMLIKYAEIYLGVAYRVSNGRKGYDGGPMYYLKAAFGNNKFSICVSVFLCIYAVEIYQFNILSEEISSKFVLNKYLVAFVLMIVVIYSSIGGVHRLAQICTALMPIFLILYIIMCSWILILNYSELFSIFPVILKSAFTGHAAVGGFAGATLIIAAEQGTARAVYSGDIGIGYDSIVQSETKVRTPARQANLAIYSLLSSTIICTFTSLIILVTGFWKLEKKLPNSEYVSQILANYFPHADIFMFILIILGASTTIIGYMVVGLKCAKYLSPIYGEKFYIVYASCSFIVCSMFDQSQVMLVMSVCSGILVTLNLLGIFKLRDKLKFKF